MGLIKYHEINDYKSVASCKSAHLIDSISNIIVILILSSRLSLILVSINRTCLLRYRMQSSLYGKFLLGIPHLLYLHAKQCISSSFVALIQVRHLKPHKSSFSLLIFTLILGFTPLRTCFKFLNKSMGLISQLQSRAPVLISHGEL